MQATTDTQARNERLGDYMMRSVWGRPHAPWRYGGRRVMRAALAGVPVARSKDNPVGCDEKTRENVVENQRMARNVVMRGNYLTPVAPPTETEEPSE